MTRTTSTAYIHLPAIINDARVCGGHWGEGRKFEDSIKYFRKQTEERQTNEGKKKLKTFLFGLMSIYHLYIFGKVLGPFFYIKGSLLQRDADGTASRSVLFQS